MEFNTNHFKKDEKKSIIDITKSLISEIEHLANKIDTSIEEFKFNVTIAHFYEIYKIFNKYLNMPVDKASLIG